MSWYHRKVEKGNLCDYCNLCEVLELNGFDLFKLEAEFFAKLSPVKLRKSSTCCSKFLNKFIKKALVLNNGCNTKYCTMSSRLVLGRTVERRSQNRNGCKIRAFIWLWLVLSLTNVIIFFAQTSLNFEDRSMSFQN